MVKINKRFFVVMFVVLGVISFNFSYYASATQTIRNLDTAGEKVDLIKTVIPYGGRVDWSKSGNNLLAYDKRGDDGFYDIWKINTSTWSGNSCLTCSAASISYSLFKNIGNPAWHPDGDYIVFQAQNPVLLGQNQYAEPGIGINNNVWIMRSDGSEYWQITNVASSGYGVLHPQFSRDGDEVIWSQKVVNDGTAYGQWTVRVGSVSFDQYGDPTVSNITNYYPGGSGAHEVYETHNFSSDDQKFLVTAVTNTVGPDEYTIYSVDKDTGSYTALTNTPDDWNEHAHYAPNGNSIVWATSRNLSSQLTTDYWAMGSSGGNKERFTYFNNSTSPEYVGDTTVGDHTWSPDGTKSIAYIQEEGSSEDGAIVIIVW